MSFGIDDEPLFKSMSENKSAFADDILIIMMVAAGALFVLGIQGALTSRSNHVQCLCIFAVLSLVVSFFYMGIGSLFIGFYCMAISIPIYF